ncbi:T6SS immunity protein Tdi1 domain-containing protein [Chitinophaga alhagiae]|uniref:T6SS immunity protein Tdi1 domain-containing protein n=1 Tax=Chitinophaga alhagiae TaxID=2203219 RepID=UPI000E5A6322|nr:T6SS immunity protein Tdi1 domain-containing protein [Chitinophaga alhagiae]
MDEIDVFLRRHPKDEGSFPPAAATTIDKYSSRLPGFLLQLWKENGYCSFSKGFFWLVNPDDLAEETAAVAPDFKGALPALRTGLGAVFFEHNGAWHSYDPVYLDVTSYENFSLADVMNYSVTADESLNEYYYHHLYKKAYKRLGPVSYDECYGFVPAVALGGELAADSLQKVKLREYLQILSQLE